MYNFIQSFILELPLDRILDNNGLHNSICMYEVTHTFKRDTLYTKYLCAADLNWKTILSLR